MLFYTSAYLFTESQNTSLCWAGAYPIVFLLYFALVSGMALGEKKKKEQKQIWGMLWNSAEGSSEPK